MANYSKNRILKCATAAVLSLSMLVTGVGIQSAPADAKSKAPALSAQKVSVAVGKSKKIKVKNVKKNAKVKVTVKKKGVVKAKVKKLNITLTGKKAGKSKVVVKVTYKKGSKKVTKNLKCTVTVKADSSSTATVAPTTAATKAAATASATAAAGTNATAAPGTVESEAPAAEETPASDATADPNAYQPPTVVVTTPKPENKVEKDGAIYGIYASAITQKENALPFTDYDSDEMIKEMGTGINLGNYMDAVSNYMTYPIQVDEKAWNDVTVTKKYFKHVHDLGFSTIRIPVTWALDKTGEINEARLSRVQEFVDYAIEEGLYVVVNVHHDGAPDNCEFQTLIQPYKIADENDLTDPIYVAYKSSWNYIAERFKNYDEHLIFESMNEVYATWYQTDKNGNIKTDSKGNPKFSNDGYNTDAEAIAPTLNKIMTMNKLFVEAVRGTGSNNAKRWLLCPPINTNIAIATNNYGATEYGFSLPEDTLEDSRIMLSVHDYTDVSVNDLNEEGTRVANRFKALKEMYVDKGHPVIVGEYGSYSIISGDWYAGSKSEFKQPYTYEAYNYLAKKNGLTILAWDTTPLVDRTGDGKDDWDIVLQAIMRGYYTRTNVKDIKYMYPEDTNDLMADLNTRLETNVKGTSITLDKSEVSLKVAEQATVTGTIAPADNDDTILWSSDDASIARVNKEGVITAKSIGETTITARSIYDDSVKADVKVTVSAMDTTNAVTDITTDFDGTYKIAKGVSAYLNAKAVTDNEVTEATDETAITFKSSNPDLVYVNEVGKLLVVGDGTGEVTITMTTGNGFSKEIKAEVVDKGSILGDSEGALNVCMAIYYYDTTEDTTATQTIAGDGTYTYTFDVTSGKKTTLADATAIYFKDPSSDEVKYDNAVITYKSCKVNGTEFKLKDNYVAASPYKGNGSAFDTNGPINVWGDYNPEKSLWDGTVFDGITAIKNDAGAVNGMDFGLSDTPTTIEITFEISGIG